MFVVGILWEEKMFGLQFGGSGLEQLMPLIILFVLNLEACLDELATIVLVGDELGVAEVGVFGDEGLLLEVLGFASAHKNYLHYFYHSTSHLQNRLSK
jgi:hypothetical protein